jgi:hypothetical protein
MRGLALIPDVAIPRAGSVGLHPHRRLGSSSFSGALGMHLASLVIRGTTMAALSALLSQLGAQSNPPPKLMGTWVMDSTNGPGDRGLPKSETLVFVAEANGFRLTATTDEEQGPSTSTFDCTTAGATTTLSATQVMLCTIRMTADSVLYTADVLEKGHSVAAERGRLVVSPSGRMLRDQYDATTGPHAPVHHRHIYQKHG